MGDAGNMRAQRTRRNILRMGPILGSAVLVLAENKFAHAEDPVGDLERKKKKHHHCFLKGTKLRTVDGERKVRRIGGRRHVTDNFRWAPSHPVGGTLSNQEE